MLHWMSSTPVCRKPLRVLLALGTAAGLVLAPLKGSTRAALTVDLVLVLALDVSGSVDDREFQLQRNGLAQAIVHPAVLATIERGARKRIAIVAVQWAGAGRQDVSVPWHVVGDAASAGRFSQDLLRAPRAYLNSRTHLSGVIDFCTDLALSAPFQSPRHVIDISGDGMDNVGYEPQRARDRAVLAGITVNGLAILNETPWLDRYYRETVIGGAGAFVIKAHDYEAYAVAILKKLIKEIDQQLLS